MINILYIPAIFGVSIEVYAILFFISIPTFFFWRWLFKKFIKADKTRKIVTWVATIFATPVIYVGLIFLIFFYMSYYPNLDFSKQKWLSDSEKRYEISKDLIESKILIGKTKAEVLQMLGDEKNPEQSNEWRYYLGFRPAMFSIDPDMLLIKFEDGKVIAVRQYES